MSGSTHPPDLFERLQRWLERIETALLVVLLAALLGLAAAEMLSRHLDLVALDWTQAALQAVLLWLIMLGSALACDRLKHLRIEWPGGLIGPGARAWINRLLWLASGVLCLALAWQGLHLVALEYRFQTVAFLDVSSWQVLMAIPVGFALMAARLLAYAVSPALAEQQPGAPPRSS